jgi:hypothetical protein
MGKAPTPGAGRREDAEANGNGGFNMHRTSSPVVSAALVALTCAFATGCGGAGQAPSASTHTTDTVSASSTDSGSSGWAKRASTICTEALADDSHELVNHLDARHIKQHGMAIVAAGSKLDALGAPAGADPGAYAHMIELYKKSAVYPASPSASWRRGTTATPRPSTPSGSTSPTRPTAWLSGSAPGRATGSG